MKVFDILNNVTDELNSIADKITGSDKNDSNASCTIQGLGIINTDNANGNIESLTCNLIDSDKRKLDTDMSKFSTDKEYKNSVVDWIKYTNIFNIEDTDTYINAQLNIIDKKPFSINYKIYCCINIKEVNEVLNKIKQDSNNIIIGYLNYNNDIKSIARNKNTQLIGVDEINEINSAIDLADKSLPYIIINKASFTHLVAHELHKKYTKKNCLYNVQNKVSLDKK